MSAFNKLSYDCVVPSSIFFNTKLEPSCVKCYAIIRNLTKIEGFCYASNAYLADAMECDISTVKRWIRNLEQEGYLEIEHEINIFKTVRRIYISDKFKNSLRRLKSEPPPAQIRATPSSKMSPLIEENSKREENNKTSTTPPNPPGGGGRASAPCPGFGTGISKKELEERKKALREIELIEVDEDHNDIKSYLRESVISKLASDLTVEEIKAAEDYVAFTAEDPEFQINCLTAFMISALKERRCPPSQDQQENIRHCWKRRDELNLKRLKIYPDYCCDDSYGKELSTSMHPISFKEAFDCTWGIKPQIPEGGIKWQA